MQVFDCEACTPILESTRNCEGSTANSRFRLQFPNKSIINECPSSYFPLLVSELYRGYNKLKLNKKLNIMTRNSDITLLEMEAYSIIENEIEKIKDYYSRKEQKNV